MLLCPSKDMTSHGVLGPDALRVVECSNLSVEIVIKTRWGHATEGQGSLRVRL